MTEGSRTEQDAHTAWSYGINVVLAENRGGIPGRTSAEVFDDYAASLLGEFGGSAGRSLAAARAACIAAADEVGHPGRWPGALCAIELCRRAAELATGSGEPPRVPADG